MNLPTSTLLHATLLTLAAATLPACSTSRSGSSTTTQSVVESAAPVPEGIIHKHTAADAEFLRSTDPIAADHITLYVDGMGCPLCVTNVDKQLLRLRGIRTVQVDLGAGTVDVHLTGSVRPSPSRLAEAVADAGNTLAKIALH